MILASWSSFSAVTARIFSSIGEIVMRRSTRTSTVWPMRCARAIACRSICGFQSESKMMTVSADCRLSPCPPARVERRKTKYEKSLLKVWRSAPRSSPLVCPSRRMCLKPHWLRWSCIIKGMREAIKVMRGSSREWLRWSCIRSMSGGRVIKGMREALKVMRGSSRE